MRQKALVLTCEHAGNRVPADFQYLFDGAEPALEAHTGWDPGALELTKRISQALEVNYFHQDVTRLLIEVNRSEGNPQLFSKYSGDLSAQVKNHLLQNYYHPYRQPIEGRIKELIVSNWQVVHLSVHTFTPVFEGIARTVDVGLLFDDERQNEKIFCQSWRECIRQTDKSLNVESNQPYKGSDDGFTTFLRTQFSGDAYLGIELEVNQKFALVIDEIAPVICLSLKKSLSAD